MFVGTKYVNYILIFINVMSIIQKLTPTLIWLLAVSTTTMANCLKHTQVTQSQFYLEIFWVAHWNVRCLAVPRHDHRPS